MVSAFQIGIDAGCCAAAFTHGENDCRGAENNVAAGEHAWYGGHVRFGIDDDMTVFIDIQAVCRGGNERIGGVANRDDNCIDIKREFTAWNLHGGATA